MALDYDAAIKIWDELGEIGEAARVRNLKTEQDSVRIAQHVEQTIIQGDNITKTEVKDSILNNLKVDVHIYYQMMQHQR